MPLTRITNTAGRRLLCPNRKPPDLSLAVVFLKYFDPRCSFNITMIQYLPAAPALDANKI